MVTAKNWWSTKKMNIKIVKIDYEKRVAHGKRDYVHYIKVHV